MSKKHLLTLVMALLVCLGFEVKAQVLDTACVTPNNLRAFRVSSNSAELMWDAYEGSMAYGLKVSTTALSTPGSSTAGVLDTLVFYKPYQVTGLTPSTSYYFYVSAMCADGSYTSWSTGGTFTTGCSPVSIPYNEGFESTTLTCWVNTFLTFGDWTGQSPAASTYAPKTITTYKSAGSRSMQLYGYRYNTGGVFRYTQAWAVSPELSTTDITSLQARFALKAGTANTYVHVGVMTDPNDYSTFEELAVLRNTNTSFTNITIPLSGVEAVAPHYYLAFYVDGSEHTASFYYYVDALVVEDAPACPQAQVLATRRVEDNKAVITWLGKAPSWNVKVSTTALTNPATDAADVATAVTSGSPYTVNGLTPSTLYYVYVQPNCTDGGGTWTGPLAFATPQVAPTLPYLCDFENASEANNWVFANNTTNGWAIGTAINHGGTHALYISNDGGNTHGFTNTSTTTASYAYRTIKFSPGTYQIMFDWHGDCETTSATTHYDYARAFLVPAHIVLEPNINAYNIAANNVPPGWKALDDLQPLKKMAGWDFCEFIHTEPDTSVYNLVFFWRNDGSGGQDPVAIDNVQIHTYTCGTPKTVTFQNITTNSAQMVWVPTSLGETTWDIQVLLNDSIVKQQTINNFPTYNITGLQASTNYTVRFRSNCGGGDVGPWRTFSFSTACGEITTLPYVESFSNYGTGTGTYPFCWRKTTTSTSVYIYTSADHTGDGGGPLYFTNNTVWTQMFNVPGKQMSDLQIEFWYRATTAGNAVEVGIMTDTTNAASFLPIDTFTIAATSTWYKAVVLLEDYTGANGAIAFRMPSGKYMYIDDVVVKEKDRCQNVLAINASNIVTTEATIDWTCSNSVTSWNLVIGRNGFDPDTCTTIYNANSKTFTFTGLTPATAYEAYVRSNCGTDGYGEWVKFNFTTMKLPAIAPFTCDFEADGEAANWDFYFNQMNKWMIGTGTATDSAGHSLYITNNDADYTYTTSTTTSVYAYATRTIVFPEAGNYNVSFDWKGMGSVNTSNVAQNYMRAFMCQNEVVIAPNSANGISNATTTPAGWTALDNNEPFVLQADWTHFSAPFSVSQPDTLKIVFYWKTGYSGGQQGPGAIDNLSVQVMVGCVTPNDFTSSISRNNATVNWNASDDATYRVKLSQTAIDPTTGTAAIDTVVNANSITFRGLSYETTYNVYVQAVCTNDTTTWGSYSFTMPCEAIYSLYEDFDASTTLPGCWTRVATQGSTLPSIYNLSASYAHSGMNSLRLNSTAGYVATPPMEPAIEDMAVSFYVYQQNETSSGLFVVGVMSDPNDFTTFVPVDTVSPTARTVEQHTVTFANSTLRGRGNYIVFYREGTSTTYGYYLDDINIYETRSCATPLDVAATNLSNNGATLSWNSTAMSHNLLVTTASVMPDSIDENDPAVLLSIDNLQGNSYSLAQMLTSNTTYYVYVQADCQSSDNRPSLWSKEYRFKTLCTNATVPYTEDFTLPTYGQGQMPDCWISGSSCVGTLPAHNVNIEPFVAGTAANHYLEMPVYYRAQSSTREKIASQSYVVLPGFTTDLDMLQFTFDIKSTSASKVVVGYMTDAGDLSTFNFVDTVRTTTNWATKVVKYHKTHTTTGYMAILADADVTLGTNNFDFRNVVVDTVIVDTIRVTVTDSLCLGTAYNDNGFNIAASDLVLGVNQFTRVNEDTVFTALITVFTTATGSETITICDTQLPYTWNGQSLTAAGTYTHNTTSAVGCDSVATLTLVVNQSVQSAVTDAICQGSSLTWNGQTLTTAGTYTHTATAANGCDSVITLTLTVNPTYNTTETLSVCPSALPYTWNGQTLTTDGTYTFNGTTAAGCDSIVTLNFTVGQSMAETIDMAVCDNDLPYAWNGQDLTATGVYTFNTTASNGCDSVVTLNLTVNNSFAQTDSLELMDTDLPYTWNGQELTEAGVYTFNGTTAEGCDSVITLVLDVKVGIDYTDDTMFAISPNPVERGGKVRIDANINETAVVEIYTSNGKLVARSEHQAKPIFVTMPEVGGLYMVRLTTETGRVMYGKVIVR